MGGVVSPFPSELGGLGEHRSSPSEVRGQTILVLLYPRETAFGD